MAGPSKTLHLRIITPKKVVQDEYVESVTAPGAEGVVTILPRHTNFFSLLTAGILTFRKEKQEESLAIGEGYLQTDGSHINILVSRAHGQNEIDEKLTQTAIDRAKKILRESKDESERHQANMLLRRSLVDIKLLHHRKKKTNL